MAHWDQLHCRPRPTPILLDRYGKAESLVFSRLVAEAQTTLSADGDPIDWASPEAILTMRKVYDQFAAFYEKNPNEFARLIAGSLRVYARLPLWTKGSRGPAFCPAAVLPSQGWMTAKAAEAASLQNTMGGDVLTAVSLIYWT